MGWVEAGLQSKCSFVLIKLKYELFCSNAFVEVGPLHKILDPSGVCSASVWSLNRVRSAALKLVCVFQSTHRAAVAQVVSVWCGPLGLRGADSATELSASEP